MATNSTFIEEHIISIATDNTFSDFQTAVITFAVIFISFYIFKMFLQHRIDKLTKKTSTILDDALLAFLKKLNFFFAFFLALYFGSNVLTLSGLIEKIILYASIIVFVYYFIKASFKAINITVNHHVDKKESAEDDPTIIEFMGLLAKIIFVTVIIIAFLSIAGINITGLLAGAGIAGIAIAFALQNILGDLFSSFTIFFDKPFKKGDFIIIDTDMGTIEKIGLKSTRIRTLQGQELVVSNRELTSTRINNYKRMEKRRIVFTLGVEYSTPHKTLKKIPDMIKKIIEEVDNTTFDRSHFKGYGDSSLNFETVYYVEVPDYNAYMDVQQEINLNVFEAFEKEGINFAFPTRTLFLNEENREEDKKGKDNKEKEKKSKK